MNAVAVRELAEVSRRADNTELLEALPDFGVKASRIVSGLEDERAAR